MTPVALLPAPAGSVDLTAFQAALQTTNPFLDNRVNGPSLRDADVPQIHQAAFERLTALAEEALRARRGLGAMLWGEAGIGKSHVLSRLARWARGRACLVYLHNLQAAPAQLPRSLLRSVISQLTGGRRTWLHGTPLFHLVLGAIRANLPADRNTFPWPRIQRAYEDWLEQRVSNDLPGAMVLDPVVFDVLLRFFRSVANQVAEGGDGRAADLAVRFLAGEGIDPDQAGLLGLSAPAHRDEPVALLDAQQIKQVLVALTLLAGCQSKPFILAFDQVDNLDDEQFASLARFLEALIDSSPNLLVVTAGIQASLVGWRDKKVIQDSAWDRLAQFQLPLHRIRSDEAGQIVRTRLQAFLQPYAGLEPVTRAVQADPFYPLGEGWRRQQFQDRVEFRPRDVINWAGEAWRQLQAGGGKKAEPGSPTPETTIPIQERVDQQVRDRVAERIAQRQREPQSLPPDEDRLVQLLYDLLRWLQEGVPSLGLVNITQPEQQGSLQPAHRLVVVRQQGSGRLRTGVLALATDNKKSITNALRRLLSGAAQVDRQLLLYDQRTGLPQGTKGQEYLQQLQEQMPQQFQELEVPFAEYAELDALHSVLGLARSGELEIEVGGQARPIGVNEAVASLHRQGRFTNSRLLRELLVSSDAEP